MKHVDEARALHDLLQQQGKQGAQGVVQAEKALSLLEFLAEGEERDPYGEGSFPKPAPLPEKDSPA